MKEPPPLVRKMMMLMMTLCLWLCRGESESVEGLFIGSFQGPSLLWTGMGLIFASSQSDLTHTVDQSPFWLFLYILSFCIIPKCRLWRDSWKTTSKTNKKKSERKPCRATHGRVWILQSQEQIWCYRNSLSNPRVCHSRCGSHIFGHSNKLSVGRHKLRLWQQTKAIHPPRARRCDWLTCAHLITVLLFSREHTNSRPTSSWPCCHFHSRLSFPWVNLSLLVSL